MKRRRLLAQFAFVAALAPMIAAAAGSGADSRRSVTTDGPVTLQVSVDRNAAQVADPIHLAVEVIAPRGTRIEMPQLAKQLGDFDVRKTENVRDVPSDDKSDARRWVLRTTLETVKTGNLEIPPLEVHYLDDPKSTTFKTVRSQPIRIAIASVLENRDDPKKFRDIKETVDLAVPTASSRAWIGWTAAGVGTAVAVALLALIVVKRRRGLSPAAWAFAAIADLEKLGVNDAATAESVYREVVDVVREFFELEFGVLTLSRTSREFLTQVGQEVHLNEGPRKRLASLISLADEIKFARLGVNEQHVRQAIENAKAFVRECDEHRAAQERNAA